MASPQKENGYTAIANELMLALAGIRISGEARQCLDVILQKTYGWNKKEDIISLSQFVLITHLGKTHIIRGLNKLAKLNLIIIQKGNEKGNKYRFNKDFDTWKPLPKKVISTITITQKGNVSLPKKVHTKTTNTKTTNTKIFPNGKISKIPLMRTYNENQFQTDGLPEIDVETGEKIVQPKKDNKNTRWVQFRAFWEVAVLKELGFKCETDKADKIAFHRIEEKLSPPEVKRLIWFFLKSKKAQEHPNITACFSKDTINLWKKNEH